MFAVVLAAVSLFVALPARAFTPPKAQGYVTDTANRLSSAERARIDAHLRAIRERTGNHVIAFLVGSLAGETIEDVAYDTFQSWKIGEAGLDNGVLLIIAPVERRLRIEVGKGLEGELTDLEAAEILRERVKPHLPAMQWERAILEGADAIAARLESRAVLRPSPANERARYDVLGWIGKSLVAGALAALAWFLLGTFFRWLWRIIPASEGGSSYSSSYSSSSYSSSSYSSSSSSSYDSGSSGGGGASDSW